VRFLLWVTIALTAACCGCLDDFDRFHVVPDGAANPDGPCGGLDQPCCGESETCQDFLSCQQTGGSQRCEPCLSSVAAGGGHSCAVTATGHLWCWGFNNDGQLGVATPSVSTVPVEVPGLTDVRSVTVGALHTCAIRRSGELFCWGSNQFGQLGGGPAAGGPNPVNVPNFNAFADASAGFSHTCAVTADHRTLCWGSNDTGQLGVDPSAYPMSPTPIAASIANGTTISAGVGHTCDRH
jgi:alpha-tubulin suppressor-like RCC1 family protein